MRHNTALLLFSVLYAVLFYIPEAWASKSSAATLLSFQLPNVQSSRFYSENDFSDKQSIYIVFDTMCKDCIEEFAFIAKNRSLLTDKNLVFVSMSSLGDTKRIQKEYSSIFLASSTFLLYAGNHRNPPKLLKRFGSQAMLLPYNFMTDKNNAICASHTGKLNIQALEGLIASCTALSKNIHHSD